MISSTVSNLSSSSANYDNNTVGFLFVGKTGAGKTTLINAFVNHLFNKNLSDDERLILIPQSKEQKCSFPEYENQVDEREFQEDNLGESKTRNVKSYVLSHDNKKILIIDTPGVGDTGGFQQDKMNIENIIQGIKKHAFIQAIIFVIEPIFRLDNMLQYYLNEIRQILTKPCSEQCLIVCTKNTGDIQDEIKDVYSKALGFTPKEDKWFSIDNYYFFNKPEEGDEDDLEMFELQWESAQQTIHEIYEKASTFPKIYTKGMVILFKKRREIETKVLELINSVERHRQLYKNHLRESKQRDMFLADARNFLDEENKKIKTTNPSKSTNFNCEKCHTTCLWDVSRFGYIAGIVLSLSIYYWISESSQCNCGHAGRDHKLENYHKFVGLKKPQLDALMEKAKSKSANDSSSESEALIQACKDTIRELMEDIAEIAVDVENIGIMPANYDSYLSYLDDYEFMLDQNSSMDHREREKLLATIAADRKFYSDIKQNLQQVRAKKFAALTDVSQVKVLNENGELEKGVKYCPNNHLLRFEPIEIEMLYECDICHKEMIAVSYRCDECNYDVCDLCK